MTGIVYPQQTMPNYGMNMPNMWAQPSWGGFSPSQYIGAPAQNLAMFGQAAQQPAGNNYFAAIMQALQGGGMQQNQPQIPSPQSWQPTSGVAASQISPPISSISQLNIQPSARIPNTPSMSGNLMQWMADVMASAPPPAAPPQGQ